MHRQGVPDKTATAPVRMSSRVSPHDSSTMRLFCGSSPFFITLLPTEWITVARVSCREIRCIDCVFSFGRLLWVYICD
jgi:hypothetical protein